MIATCHTYHHVTIMNKQQNIPKLLTTDVYIHISCKCDTNRAGHFTLDAYASRPVACVSFWMPDFSEFVEIIFLLYGYSYLNQSSHYQPRVLVHIHLRWVHFDQKCLAARSSWGKNESDAHQYDEWYISSDSHHSSYKGVYSVLPSKPWNIGCDLLKFVRGTKMSKNKINWRISAVQNHGCNGD